MKIIKKLYILSLFINIFLKLIIKELYKVIETNDYFYLYFNEDYAALVSKNGFKLGDSKEFSKFIKKKCFLKYQRNSEKL